MPWNTAIYQTMTEAEFAAGAIGKSEQGKRIGSNLENLNSRLSAVEGTQRADALGVVPVEFPPFGLQQAPEWYFKIPVVAAALAAIGATGETLIDGGLLIPQASASFNYALLNSKAGKIKVGSYTGTGSSGNAITGVGFQPDALFIMQANQEGTEDEIWLTTKDAIADAGGILTTNFADEATVSNLVKAGRVQSLDADGFTLNTGSDPNSSGVTYHYLAILDALADATLKTAIGTYTGDGASNRSITGLGFTPQIVFVFENATFGGGTSRSYESVNWLARSNALTHVRGLTGNVTPSGFSGDQSHLEIVSDGIKVSGSSGSDGLNGNTKNYIYVAMKGGAIST